MADDQQDEQASASDPDEAPDPVIGRIPGEALPELRALVTAIDKLGRALAVALFIPIVFIYVVAVGLRLLGESRRFCERFPEFRTVDTLFPGVKTDELKRRARSSALLRRVLRFFEARRSLTLILVVPVIYGAAMLGMVVYALSSR